MYHSHLMVFISNVLKLEIENILKFISITIMLQNNLQVLSIVYVPKYL